MKTTIIENNVIRLKNIESFAIINPDGNAKHPEWELRIMCKYSIYTFQFKTREKAISEFNQLWSMIEGAKHAI